MRLPATLALVVRRARANPAPVVAVAINVLVVCTLVSGLAASLTLLQREALRSALSVAPPEATVVAVASPYDEEEPAAQDAAVRKALEPVVSLVGGEVVGLAQSGTYDVRGSRQGRTVAAVSEAGAGRLDVPQGRQPAAASTTLEVAVPADAPFGLGDELTLVSRSDDRRVSAVVVGRWELRGDSRQWLSGLDPAALLVAPERFPDVAAAGTVARWRAVPELAELAPAQMAPMVAAVVTAQADLETVAEELSTSVQSDTGLVESLGARARELTVLRALLLVPAGLLVLVAAAGLVLVASGLAEVRRDEEALLRSRGAGHRQLTGPTVLETLLLCGVAALVAPLLATAVVRIGDVRPPLTVSAWTASLAAAAACAVALTVPVLVRAVTGDRGRQLSTERQRRRTLTLLVATLVLVAALGVLAVVELRAFGDSVGSATAATGVDPLLVSAPALLMLAVAVLASLLVLPPLFRLLSALLGSRGVPLALGSRFAARSPGRAVPLALSVTLAAGTLAFAAVERSSSAAARLDRAAYVAGADVRVTAPPPAQRAGVLEERAVLETLAGVESVAPVHRDTTFVDDLPAEVLLADLSRATKDDLLGPDAGDWQAAVARPWAADGVGVVVPDGSRSLSVAVAGAAAADLLLAGPKGRPWVVPGRARRGAVVADVAGLLPSGTRLVGLRTDLKEAPPGEPPATVRADGTALRTPTTWWDTDGPAFVLLADRQPTLPAQVPVLLTEELAGQASLEVGDTLTLTLLGVPTGLEVAGTVPHLRTVADGSGGVLVDAATALPTLLAAGVMPEPDEWWLTVRPGAEEAVASALAERPDVAEAVLTGEQVLAQLDDDPSTGGSALGQVLLLTAAGCLVVGVLLLVSLVLLRRRERAEQARMLGAAGGDRGALTGVLSWEYAVVAGAGVLAGMVAGASVAAVTLASMTLGPDGQLLQPAPELVVPWLAVVVPPLVMVGLPLLAMVWLIRRDHAPGLGASGGAGGSR